MAIGSDRQRSKNYNKLTKRRTVGCEVGNSRESGETEAEDAANFINKGNICRVYKSYRKS